MTVETLHNTSYFTSNGVIKVFQFTFATLDEGHIEVYVNDVLQISGFTVLVNPDQDTAPGGTVTFDDFIPSGSTISIIRNVPVTQEVDYAPFDAFPAETHEDALDKITMVLQQIGNFIVNVIGFAPSVTDAVPLIIDANAVDRANTVIGFDEDGNFILITIDPDGGETSPFIYIPEDIFTQTRGIGAGQTIVNFSDPTENASFYLVGPNVDNGRLSEGDDYTNNIETRTITLTQTYPAGTNLVMVYNDTGDNYTENVIEVFNTLNDMKQSPLAVNRMVATKGKDAPGDDLGSIYVIEGPQVVDEVQNHTLVNGNTAMQQLFSATVEADIGALEADVAALQASEADHEARISALEAAIVAITDLFEPFESSELTITGTGQNTSVSHGFASAPRFASAVLRCKVAEHGYQVGDELSHTLIIANSGEEEGLVVYSNSTVIGFITGDRYPMSIYDTNGIERNITFANWRVVLRAIL